MNTKNFTDYVLNVCPDNSFEDDFKSLHHSWQIEFVLYMVEIFRTWSKEDFQKFNDRNVVDIIFGNLTMDSRELFVRIVGMEFRNTKNTPNWTWFFSSMFKKVKGIDIELAKYRMEKDEFNDHQIKNRK